MVEELKTEVVISEETKTYREDLMKKLIRGAYKECKNEIREKGTISGADCMSKKLSNKEWQIKFIQE